MPASGTIDRTHYLEEWTRTMINIWEERLLLLDVNDTGALYRSLEGFLKKNASGEVTVIEHFFNYYGVYVDRGTGRGFSKGNGGDIGITPIRKPKPWFNGKFYYYTMKLAEKMAEISGQKFAYVMQEIIQG